MTSKVIHARDKRTLQEIAEMREQCKIDGTSYDSSPEIRLPIYNFQINHNQRDRSNTVRIGKIYFISEIKSYLTVSTTGPSPGRVCRLLPIFDRTYLEPELGL